MARIPLGEFDQPRAVPRTQPSRVDLSGSMDALRATDRAGQIMEGVAGRHLQNIHQQRAADEAKAAQETEALARARAANGLADYRLRVEAAAADVQDQLRRGVDYTRAGELYTGALAELELPQVEGLPPDAMEAFQGGIAQTRQAGRLKLDGAIVAARRDAGQTEFARLLDTLGKAAGQPGADVAGINAQARAAAPLFQEFGLDGSVIDKALQDFADKNWTNHATQRFNLTQDDPDALGGLLADLTEGAYSEHLDADKRNAIAARVSGRIDVLQDRAAAAGDRAAAAAERALSQMDAQFATGVPATAEQWAAWAGAAEAGGAEFQEQLRQRVDSEREIQQFLRQPIDVQLRGVQEQQAKLMREGGDQRAIANVNRVRSAVEANVKMLQESPLEFAQARLGENVEPLPLQALATEPAAVGAALQHRATVVAGLRRQYGPQVRQALLLPQEAQVLTSALEQQPPKQRVAMYAQLRQVAGSDATYRAVMGQVAPDAPVTALAGMLHLNNPKAAALVAEGQAVLAGEKAVKQPSQTDFDVLVSEAVGDAFRDRPEAYSIAMQAVQAGYAGAAATDGDVTGELNERRLENVVRAVLGETVDFNGRGGVFVPYGMDPDRFEERIVGVWQEVRVNLREGAPLDLDNYGLQQAGDGRYYVTMGRSFATDRQGRPLVLEIRR